jgi:Fe-Mn family superoxide dismutase
MSLIDKNELDKMLKGFVKQAMNATGTGRLSELDEAFVHEPKPFKQVSELVSQKTKSAHEELYKGYVEAFNKISAELDTADRSDANVRRSAFRNLKLDETWNLNALWLHELYFANCFDPHSEIVMDSLSYMRLERDFGTFEDWQRDFMACALASRGGWAVCGYHTFLKKYVNFMIDEHSGNVSVGFYPLIVVDMWEHAYYRDYLTDKKSYLISQMREFNWNVIEERIKKAEGIAQVVK